MIKKLLRIEIFRIDLMRKEGNGEWKMAWIVSVQPGEID